MQHSDKRAIGSGRPHHLGYWTRTTLYLRNWLPDDITTLLGDPDLVEDYAQYFRKERVLGVEPLLPQGMRQLSPSQLAGMRGNTAAIYKYRQQRRALEAAEQHEMERAQS